MIKENLVVFSVGTEWFIAGMKGQGIDVRKVEWSPPPEVPKDIALILEKMGAR
jgi:hypothetical protein